jgi:hypothetical protein
MWAVGVYDLHLPASQFWRLSPKEFDALCARRNIDEKRQLYNAALIASMVYNVKRGKGKKALQPKDFMPPEQVKHSKMSATEMKAQAAQIASMFKGK